MSTLELIVLSIVALLHIYFFILEMFLWDKPIGLKTFGHLPEQAAITKVLAANQGLYNGFLAAGVIWGMLLGAQGDNVKLFFLSCILIAGIFGGFTASRKIFFVQALPAAMGLLLVLISKMFG